jgi:large subunit ribosomal protein L18
MKREKRKQDMRRRRHFRVSNRVRGTAGRPRLAVSRTLKHIYAQVIDDQAGRTLVSTSTLAEEVRKQVKSGGNVKAAELVGTQIAQLARAAGIEKVAFDRGPCRFHGRVKALAEAARKGGLKF